MLSDVKFAFRSLLKSPGFTVVAVLILGLGIGANTAIFSACNAVLLRSLAVPDPQNLRTLAWSTDDMPRDIMLWVSGSSQDGSRTTYDAFSYPTYEAFRDRAVGFESIFAFVSVNEATVKTSRGAPTAEEGLFVSGNFFKGYGGQPMLGRLLNSQDDRPDAAPVAVITYRLWAERFALDPHAIGKTVTVNGVSLEVVGVLPRDYRGPLAGDPTRFYVSLALSKVIRQSSFIPLPALMDSSLWALQIMGRRDTKTSERQAQASIDMLFKQSLGALGKPPKPGKTWRGVVTEGRYGPLSTSVMQQAIKKPIYILAGAAAALLLLTCANLASLMLARAFAREREWAVRAAVGAGRWRLVRQPLIEASLLASTGCVLGILIAAWFADAADLILPHLLPAFQLPQTASFRTTVDVFVLSFAIAVAFLTALFCAAFPALHAVRTDPLAGMNKAAVRAPRQTVAKTLICAQVALSVVLLIGAGLLARTSFNLIHIAPGFDPENVLLFDVPPGQSAGADKTRKIRFFGDVLRSVSTIPGVHAASLSSMPLLSGRVAITKATLHGDARKPNSVDVHILTVGDSFLSTMRIELLSGREFTPMDHESSEPVAVVNQAFSRAYLKGHNPVGARFDMNNYTYRVVGLARDSLFVGVKDEKTPLAYLSFRQAAFVPGMTIAVRSTLSAGSLIPAIKKAVAAVDPDVPVTNVRTQNEQIGKLTATERLLAAFSSAIAALAAVLSGFGLFGLLAYSVTRRTNEIGVRTALGAQHFDVIKLIVGQGLRIVALGAMLGCLFALWATRLLSSFLFEVKPTDPLTMMAAVLAFGAVAAVASYLPARRAAKIDPLVALRAE